MSNLTVDGMQLNEGERMRLLRTIEGDIEPDSHDFVSNLKPRDSGDELFSGCTCDDETLCAHCAAMSGVPA